MLIATYINLRLSGVLDIQLANHAKYLIPLPPMFEDVIDEGALLG